MGWVVAVVFCLLGAVTGGPTLAVGVGAALALLGIAALAPGSLTRPACWAALAVLALWWGGLRAQPTPPVGSPEGRVSLEGTVHRVACDQPDRCQWVLVEASADGVPLEGPVFLRTFSDALAAAAPGDAVAIGAHVRGEARGTNPGIDPPWQAPGRRWHARATTPGHPMRRLARGSERGALRARLVDALTLPGGEVTQVLRALLLGDRSGLDPSLRRAFTDSGTAHLLAISGLHLAVIGLGLYRALLLLLVLLSPSLAQAGRPPAWAAGMAGGLTWLYVLLIAPSQATLRAAVVLSLVFLGAVLARRARPVSALRLALTVLVLADPLAAATASFQLSFAAAAALVLGMPRLSPWLKRLDEPGYLPDPFWRWPARVTASLLVVSLLSSVVTAPLTLAWFGQLALIGPLVNLVAVPLVSLLVVPLGFVWLLIALVLPSLAALVAPVPTFATGLLLDLVEGWAEVVGPATATAWPHLAGLAGAAACVLLLSGRRARLPGLAAALATAALVAAASPTSGELRLTALDVGHGDALLVELPEGAVMLVDSGGSPSDRGDDSLANRRLVPALARLGYARLDLLVITHADHDHVGAAAALARRVDIAELWLPACGTSSPAIVALARRVAARGGRVRRVHAAAPLLWSGAELEVLWPPADVRGPDGRCALSPNDAGVVLSLRHARRHVLLAADAEHAAEQGLIQAHGQRLRADVLKVGHHGSRTSSSPQFLDVVHPRLALISGRRRPGPMPPHLDILQRYHRRHVPLFLTGRDGALRLRIDGAGAMTLQAHRGRSWGPEP